MQENHSPSPSGPASDPRKAGNPTALRNQAYERFTELVLASQLKPGQFVSQHELTLLLGMPLGAVREISRAWKQPG